MTRTIELPLERTPPIVDTTVVADINSDRTLRVTLIKGHLWNEIYWSLFPKGSTGGSLRDKKTHEVIEEYYGRINVSIRKPNGDEFKLKIDTYIEPGDVVVLRLVDDKKEIYSGETQIGRLAAA